VLVSRLIDEAEQRKGLGLFRTIKVNAPSSDALDFAANDYLGFARHPLLIERQTSALKCYGSGGRASELVAGHTLPHQAFCEEFADFMGFASAMLFSSGYAANTGVLRALLRSGDFVLHDRLNHASLLDATQFPGVRFKRFRHNDTAHLEALLLKQPKALVAVEGVYSMDGDCAPLAQIAQLRGEHTLYVDDAHGLGVIGEQGRGILSATGVSPCNVALQMNTLGKAMGSMGAVVSGSCELIDGLHNFAKSYVYSTALPAHQVAAAQAALELLKTEPEHQQNLESNIVYFRQAAIAHGLQLVESKTAIQPIMCANPVEVAAKLRVKGIHVGAIRPPTVPVGEARLRITISATHSKTDIDRLIEALGNV